MAFKTPRIVVWNGTEISEWNMKDARMEWNISKMEWKKSLILHFVHGIYRKIYTDVELK